MPLPPLEIEVWNTGTEGMEYIYTGFQPLKAIWNACDCEGVLVITYLLRQLFFMCYTSFCFYRV